MVLGIEDKNAAITTGNILDRALKSSLKRKECNAFPFIDKLGDGAIAEQNDKDKDKKSGYIEKNLVGYPFSELETEKYFSHG